MTIAVVVLAGGSAVPAAAMAHARTATAYATSTVDSAVAAALGAQPVPDPEKLLAHNDSPVVVYTTERREAQPLLDAGAEVISTPGGELVRAAAVMDRLRSPGGCPWDAEQTHDSLRRYLVEECYELLDALAEGDRAAMREELGDVLLQVLFHARVAAEDAADPFTVDDVARELIDKLVARHPHVFGDGDDAVRDARSQERRWEELKQTEKQRQSSVDGVAMGQPALALAAKLAQRTARAGLPGALLPKPDSPGARLFDLAALIQLSGEDPEGRLREVARQFAADVRAAEDAARTAGVDPAAMDHAAWHRFWPARDSAADGLR